MWCEQCYSSFNDLCLNDSPTSLPPGPFPCSQTNLFSFTHPTHLLTSSTCHSSDLPSTATTLDHEFLLPVTDQNSLLISLSTDTPSTLAVYSVPQSEQIFLYNFFDRGSNSKLQQYKKLEYTLHQLHQLFACCPFIHTHSLSPTCKYMYAFFQNHLKVNCIYHAPLTKLFRVCFLRQRHYLM